ncbi:MAG: alpha/beta hydrolase [Candidatus Omnitrophota bacterium]
MISSRSAEFQYHDRGERDTIVLIPGWAADHRVFGTQELRYNYLIPVRFSPRSFEQDLLGSMRERGIRHVTLFGWSLGGFLAAEFAARHAAMVDHLILMSVRRRFNRFEVQALARSLARKKTGCLMTFYKRWFAASDDLKRFLKTYGKAYAKELELEPLAEGLRYLTEARIDPAALSDIKRISIIHGEDDSVCPIEEALAIKKELANADFYPLKGAGHMPFFEEDIGRLIV